MAATYTPHASAIYAVQSTKGPTLSKKDCAWMLSVGLLIGGACAFSCYHVFGIDWYALALPALLSGVLLAGVIVVGSALAVFSLIGLMFAFVGTITLFERRPERPSIPKFLTEPRTVPSEKHKPRPDLRNIDPMMMKVFDSPGDAISSELKERLDRTWLDVAQHLALRSPVLLEAVYRSRVRKVVGEFVVIEILGTMSAHTVFIHDGGRELVQELWDLHGGPPFTIRFVFKTPKR